MDFVLIYIDTESDCIIKAFLYCNQLSNDSYRSDNIECSTRLSFSLMHSCRDDTCAIL